MAGLMIRTWVLALVLTFAYLTLVTYATLAVFRPLQAVQVAVAAGAVYGFAFAAVWTRLRRLEGPAVRRHGTHGGDDRRYAPLDADDE